MSTLNTVILWGIAGLFAASAAMTAYVFGLRPWGRRMFPRSWYDRLCDRTDPYYAALFGGSRTMFLARLTWFWGYVVMGHDFVTPILVELASAGFTWETIFDPQTAKVIGALNIVLGHAFAKLRVETNGPVQGEPPPPPPDADDVTASGRVVP